ncbi:alpha/beta fold hydrolase [Mucilaginibacter sp.]|uniref:alpha/beta fold hydrolase n=1 Tax=Mucilaginibacter sp. TaxID=1882438 RepID=UPI003563BDC7
MKLHQRLFLFVLCSVAFACTNPEHKTQKNSKAKVNIVSNNVRIDYTDTGSGDTTLLFVHGWCINKTYWADQIAHFSKRYRVVAIDLPGFGKSGRNRNVWTTAAFGEDIKNVITQLDLKNVVLIGHSMAGDIILQGAVNIPGRVIALVGVDNFKSAGVPFTGDSVKAKKEYTDAIAAMKRNFKATTFGYFNQALFYKTTTKAVKDRVLNDVAHADPVIATACMEQQDDYPEAAKLLQVKKKLYLINSDYTPTDTSGLVAKKIPYRLLEIHATGHFPMIEKPQEFNTLLDKAMADIK